MNITEQQSAPLGNICKGNTPRRIQRPVFDKCSVYGKVLPMHTIINELFLIIARVQELRPDYKKIEFCDAETRNRLTVKLIKETVA